MAKKSNAKRSKSGAKTPRGASRPGSPIPDAGGREPDGEEGQAVEVEVEEGIRKGDDDNVAEQEPLAGTGDADEAERGDEVEAVQEEEVTLPTKVNGTTGKEDGPTTNGPEKESGPPLAQADEIPAVEEVDGTERAVGASTPVVQATLPGDDESPASAETQDDEQHPSPTVDNGKSDASEEVPIGVDEAEVEHANEQEEDEEIVPGTEADNPTPSDPNNSDSDAENEDPEDEQTRIQTLESDLAQTLREKEHLSTQYRTLLGKLQQMRNSLGEKLKEDAEELDRREILINQLTTDLQATQTTVTTVQMELASLSQENVSLDSQLAKLRLENQQKNEQESNDVVSLTRELRELRGDLERVRMEREEWEEEAGRERGKREQLEEDVRGLERRLMDAEERRDRAEDGWRKEEKRAGNLEDVLGEFQAAKDLEISQATSELESQLRYAASSLAEYKSRAADAENRLSNLQNDAGRSAKLDKELADKTAMIGKLRHDSVVTQEHLTEALRRLRRNTSGTNVDRRLVTNILLQFITTPRADPKRFEMLSLLATILSWEDEEREKAGLQRVGGGGGPKNLRRQPSEIGGSPAGKGKGKESAPDTYNESFSNLFVEFLLKEAAQGQTVQEPNQSSSHGSSRSPPGSIHPGTPATERGATTPGGGLFGFARSRTYSTASVASTQAGGMKSPPYVGSIGRKGSTPSIAGNGTGTSPMSPREASSGLLSPPGPGRPLVNPDLPGPRR